LNGSKRDEAGIVAADLEEFIQLMVAFPPGPIDELRCLPIVPKH
jgi:hypothetical protein